jgi:hypothetical protein
MVNVTNKCPEYGRLQARMYEILARTIDITTAQFEAFKLERGDEFLLLDKELESAISAKIRTVEEMKVHVTVHGCQSSV